MASTGARELTEKEKTDHHVPPHGRWFMGTGAQALMLDIYRENPVQNLAIAWDQNKAKMYGVYTTITRETFAQLLLDTPRNYRYGYELLVENEPCYAYCDIDWYGPMEDGPPTIVAIVQTVRAKITETYNIRAEIYVCRSSRTEGERYKHSYHMVCHGLAFARNDDGQMLEFFTSIKGFTYTTIDKKTNETVVKSMIDSSVYTKNRCMRFPPCCKNNTSKTPFVRISGDPLEDDDLDLVFEDQNFWENTLPFFITKPDQDAFLVPAKSTQLVVASQLATAQKRPREAIVAPPPSKACPFPVSLIQQMLNDSGDDSVLGVPKYNGVHENKWQIQGTKRGSGRRKCLSCPNGTTSHGSNNCILFIEPFDRGGFKVYYFCTDKDCAKNQKNKPILGYLCYNLDTHEWEAHRTYKKPRITPPLADAAAMMIMDVPQPASASMAVPQPAAASMAVPPPAAASMAVPQPAMIGDVLMQPVVENINEVSVDDADETLLQPAVGQEVVEMQPTMDHHNICAELDVNNPLTNTYEIVKERFERGYKKERFMLYYPTTLYVYVDHTRNTMVELSHGNFETTYRDWTFWGPDKRTGEIKKQKFIQVWLDDPNKRKHDLAKMDPENKETDIYNLWRGYLAAKYPPPASDEEAERDFKPFADHILEVYCNGDQQHAKWVIEYLANIVQYPARKTGVAMLIYGIEGCGKGILIDYFRNHILGPHCTMKTANAPKDLFSTFSNGHLNNVLVQVDELGNIQKYTDTLKDLISSDDGRYEGKCKNAVTVVNMCNFIFTTNNKNALHISENDRRIAMFESASTYVKNKAHFQKLSRHLSRKKTMSAVYYCLKKIDLSKYYAGEGAVDFDSTKPRTAYYYEEMKAVNVSIVSKFLSAIINDNIDSNDQFKVVTVDFPAKTFLLKYIDFGRNEDTAFSSSQMAFGTAIKPLLETPVLTTGLSKFRGNGGFKYKIVLEQMKSYLESVRQYDPDVFLV